MKNLLNKLFGKNGPDHLIALTVFLTCCFGVIMIGSASVGESVKYGAMYPTKNMLKQAMFIVIGFFAYFIIVKSFKRKLINEHTVKAIYIIGIIGLCACRLFRPIKGSYNWIPLGFMTLQPSEFMKVIMMIYLGFTLGEKEDAYYIDPRTRKKQKERLKSIKLKECLYKPVIFSFLPVGIVLFVQKDMGSAAILLFICLMIFLCNNKPFYRPYQKLLWICFFIGLGLIAFIGPIMLKVLKGYQLGRINTWLNPLSDPQGEGWQLVNGMIAFASGITGKGFNASSQKFGYIPEAHNDFIGSIIFEELGIVGLACIIVPYTIIIFRIFKYAQEMEYSKCKLYCYGVSAYFFAHLLINLGGISGLIPMTGVPLLLISSGGSSTLSAICAIAIAQGMIGQHNRNKHKEKLALEDAYV